MQAYLDILNRAVTDFTRGDRPVVQAPAASELQQKLDLSLQQDGADLETLEQAVKDYLHYNPDSSQADYFKLLYSGRNEPALLGDWVTSLSNATMHTYQVGPVATLMELELIKSWNALVGFTEGDGLMVSGGSQANLIGMMLARHKACPEYKTRGADGRRLIAYVSDQAHYSAQKAVNVLGIGSDNLVAVATDAEGRMCPVALEAAIETSLAAGHQPFYISLTAGTTVVGAYDPVVPCRAVADKYDLWLHIDGAWGAPVLFSEESRHLLADSGLADSFAWDAHKLMNVPITAAVILVKQAGLLTECFSGGGGEYLFHNDENAAFNLGERSMQCGRRADSLKVWLSWKAIGNKGFAAKIDYLQGLKAQCVAQVEQSAQLEMIAPSVYLNVVFRYKPEGLDDEQTLRRLNIAITKTMMRNGGAYVDYAQYKGRSGIRLILANDAAQSQNIERFLEACITTGKALMASGEY
ncbi:pyridoxal phosphate-dependent decarboxylase family protein [Aliamphritea ceti]|uniref:pyridoxal phosphate-dependent decarboxylase family protein n=1 Tax=Aliamphritea ceti TaxID=1524258 RepID=UPI0021C34350|nr:pyridoxal-dependent decarboxylase [Aliamphritea ceti]